MIFLSFAAGYGGTRTGKNEMSYGLYEVNLQITTGMNEMSD